MSYASVASGPIDISDQRSGRFTIILTTCAINILGLALPIATLQMYDRVLQGQNIATMHMLVAGVLIALLLEVFLRLGRSYITTRRGASFVHGMSCQAIGARLKSRARSEDNENTAEELSNLGAIKGLRDFKSGTTLITVVDLCFLPLYIFVMAYISEMLVLVPVGLLAGYAILAASNGLKIRSQLEKMNAVDVDRFDFLLEGLNSNKVMKSLALERQFLRRFERHHAASCQESFRLSNTITNAFASGTTLSHIMTASTVTVGGYMAVHGSLTVGALIAVVLLSSRLMLPVQKFVLLWIRFQDYQQSNVKAQRILGDDQASNIEYVPAPDNVRSLEIVKLCYRPNERSRLILDDVNLSLQVGQSILLDGPAASGRSTLLKIIAGMRVPTSGRVELNGCDISRIVPTELSATIAYLSPHTQLFRGTIRDNVTRFGQVSTASAMEVAEILQLDEEFARLPLGIDTVVGGDKGSVLTPSVVQMICILRSLATRPRFILFDEADAGLDPRAYNVVLSTLTRLKSRVGLIIVSRDLNIRQICERSAYLNDAKIIETAEKFDSRPQTLLRL